jgi:hypothetical protein
MAGITRRSFLKRASALAALFYFSPVGMIKESASSDGVVELSFEAIPFDIDHFSEKFIKPAMIELANKLDADVLNLYLQEGNYV